MTSCPKCRRKLEYMPELAKKGKPSHFRCGYCGVEWLITRKERSWSVSTRRNKQFGKIENPYHQASTR